MKMLVTGKSGFVGRHVMRELESRDVEIVPDFTDRPEAVIHLGWGHLPNYESYLHAAQVQWHHGFLSAVIGDGITNITAAGSCLELVDDPPPYGLAKISVRDGLLWRLPTAKWVRFWNVYGPGQREECLLPSLRRAMERGDESFQVIDGMRDFIPVQDAARRLVDIALQEEESGVFDCGSGTAVPVIDFCRKFTGDSAIRLETGYPMPSYEPKVFSIRNRNEHGDR